jgi:hypothetical protein
MRTSTKTPAKLTRLSFWTVRRKPKNWLAPRHPTRPNSATAALAPVIARLFYFLVAII